MRLGRVNEVEEAREGCAWPCVRKTCEAKERRKYGRIAAGM